MLKKATRLVHIKLSIDSENPIWFCCSFIYMNRFNECILFMSLQHWQSVKRVKLGMVLLLNASTPFRMMTVMDGFKGLCKFSEYLCHITEMNPKWTSTLVSGCRAKCQNGCQWRWHTIKSSTYEHFRLFWVLPGRSSHTILFWVLRLLSCNMSSLFLNVCHVMFSFSPDLDCSGPMSFCLAVASIRVGLVLHYILLHTNCKVFNDCELNTQKPSSSALCIHMVLLRMQNIGLNMLNDTWNFDLLNS